MPTPGRAVVIVMPSEEETTLVEKIGNILSKLAMSGLHLLTWGIVLGGTSLIGLLQLNRKGIHDYFIKMEDVETAIIAAFLAFLILSILWGGTAYLTYFRKRRLQMVAELERLTQDPAVLAAIEKLRRIEKVVGPLERFDSVLDRLQRPDRFTRRHLAPLLRPL